MVERFGIERKDGTRSFRHTIRGASSTKGFEIVDDQDQERVVVLHTEYENLECAHWTYDVLLNSFISKFRHLIIVAGKRSNDLVTYSRATFHKEPSGRDFIKAVIKGIVAIDFDMRTKLETDSLRNHGTKFRINIDDLPSLYSSVTIP